MGRQGTGKLRTNVLRDARVRKIRHRQHNRTNGFTLATIIQDALQRYCALPPQHIVGRP